jgi:zinc transporter ZupT
MLQPLMDGAALTVTETSRIQWPLILALMLWFHCLIGLVAARVAYRKGGDLALWLPWGLLGGTAALVGAIAGPPKGRRLPG